MNLTAAAQFYGYTRFYKLVEVKLKLHCQRRHFSLYTNRCSRGAGLWTRDMFVICSAGCGFDPRPEHESPQAVHHVVAHRQSPQLPAGQQTTVAL